MSQKFECRICYVEEQNKKKLIYPCACNGTNKYVHRVCLDKWRFYNQNRIVEKKCMECNQNYILEFEYPKETYKIYFFSGGQDAPIFFILINCILFALGVCFKIIDQHYRYDNLQYFMHSQKIYNFDSLFNNSHHHNGPTMILFMLYVSYTMFLITALTHVILISSIYYNVNRKKKYCFLTIFSHFAKLILSFHFLWLIYLNCFLKNNTVTIMITFILNLGNIYTFYSISNNHNKNIKLLNDKFNNEIIKNFSNKIDP